MAASLNLSDSKRLYIERQPFADSLSGGKMAFMLTINTNVAALSRGAQPGKIQSRWRRAV
jgi:hypothetical protein